MCLCVCFSYGRPDFELCNNQPENHDRSHLGRANYLQMWTLKTRHRFSNTLISSEWCDRIVLRRVFRVYFVGEVLQRHVIVLTTQLEFICKMHRKSSISCRNQFADPTSVLGISGLYLECLHPYVCKITFPTNCIRFFVVWGGRRGKFTAWTLRQI